jgi:ELWxxDGT repeat protein
MLNSHTVTMPRRALVLLLALLPVSLLSGRGRDSFTDAGLITVDGGVVWFGSLCRSDGTSGGTRCAALPLAPGERVVPVQGRNFVLTQSESGTAVIEVMSDLTTKVVLSFDSRVRAWGLMTDGTNLLCFTQLRPFSDGVRLVRIDPASSQTSLVSLLQTRSAQPAPRVGNSALFRILGPGLRGDYEVWRTDGTAGGTKFLIPDDIVDSEPLGDLLLIRAANHVWRTDGTTTGTFPLATGRSGVITSGGRFAHFVLGDSVFRTDGTTVTSYGPFLATSLGINASYVREAAMAGNRLILLERFPAVWRILAVDGSGPPVLIGEIWLPGYAYAEAPIRQVGELVYIAAPTTEGTTLWRTDGTAGGTFKLPGHVRFSPDALASFGERLLFSGTDDLHGYEPWISDGTAAGTFMLANVAREGTITGTVTDAATGERLGGIAITIFVPGELHARTTTDADGRYVVQGVTGSGITVQAEASEWYLHRVGATSVQVLPDEEERVDLALQRGARITGVVTTAGGVPLRDAYVRLNAPAHPTLGRVIATDANGRFSINAIAPGLEYTIRVNDHPKGFARTAESAPFLLRAGELRTFDFALQPWGRVRVRVLDADTGLPPARGAGASFHTTPNPTWSSSTETRADLDANGYAEAALREGSYYVSAGATYFEVTTAGPFTVQTATNIAIEPLLLRPKGSRLSIRVLDDVTHEPVPGVYVRVARPDGYVMEDKQTDGAGMMLTLPSLAPGIHTVTAYGSKYASTTISVPIVGPRETVTATIYVPLAAYVHGTVVDAVTGAALAYPQFITDPQSGYSATPTTFSISASPGILSLRVDAIGWQPILDLFTLAPGDVVTRNYRLQPDCRAVITPAAIVADAKGGTHRFHVDAPADCSYRVRSTIFVSVPEVTRTGSSDIDVTVLPNTSARERMSTLVLPGATAEVRQPASAP